MHPTTQLEAEQRYLALRRALDAVRRALDPDGTCLEDCDSWHGDDCDCGYIDAADDAVRYISKAPDRY